MNTYNQKLSVFMYNKKMIQSLLLNMICSIREYYEKNYDITVWKRWQLGPHIEIIVSGSKTSVEKCISCLKASAENFIGSCNIPQDESYENYEKLSERVAVLEGYKDCISPLRKHLEITTEPFDWNTVNTIFPHDIYKQIENLTSRFLCEAFPYYHSLNENEKDLFLTKCMVILGNQQEKTEEFSGGIKYGYMTFQSHYHGFRSQLNETPNERMIKQVLNLENRCVVEGLKSEMSNLTDMEINFEREGEKERLMYLWRDTVNSMLGIYESAVVGDEIKWNDTQRITGFFERNKDKLSQFHSSLEKKENYMGFLDSVFFVKHRLAINEFYKMLPLFGVSPLKKHQLCKYVSEAVEEYYGQNYNDVMEKINAYYKVQKETV